MRGIKETTKKTEDKVAGLLLVFSEQILFGAEGNRQEDAKKIKYSECSQKDGAGYSLQRRSTVAVFS
ncbi:hypothetical protein DSCA_20290 [Desulfosarcina alkanivorans]|uniref:Uncharacterized protein n=1 Tax=Desulfosarcina alkanivorans TaxID=571177 RepID=A0A5K7YJS8_9BACT|nr:hypothetical protein [Desulfosarcina alkanivorans]BBO68099.1 hypothetical protein DSCA_20290 [Desulfosarcina alkanivorans]